MKFPAFSAQRATHPQARYKSVPVRNIETIEQYDYETKTGKIENVMYTARTSKTYQNWIKNTRCKNG